MFLLHLVFVVLYPRGITLHATSNGPRLVTVPLQGTFRYLAESNEP